MAQTDITFTGLRNLWGRKVSCCIAGLDCGDYTVSALGTIVVPITAHPAMAGGAYIASVAALGLDAPNNCAITLGDDTYIVPVTIGLAYTTKGKMLRPMNAEDIRSASGGGLGKLKRGHQYSFLFASAAGGQGSGALSVGTDFSTLYAVTLREPDKTTPWPDTSAFAGVHWDALNDQASFDTMICWQVSRPVPMTVTASAVHLHSEDR